MYVLTSSNVLANSDKKAVSCVTEKLHSLTTDQLCLLSICALKSTIPIWNEEIKQRYIVYADHVCGVAHKIDKCIIERYLFFLENNHEKWNHLKINDNRDILELWVAATDLDFDISRKGYFILMAVYSLMDSIEKKHTEGYFELFAQLSQIFESTDEFSNFFTEVEIAFMKHPLHMVVQNCPVLSSS